MLLFMINNMNTTIDTPATYEIELTRVNNDINGNPRYVCHYSELLNDSDNFEL